MLDANPIARMPKVVRPIFLVIFSYVRRVNVGRFYFRLAEYGYTQVNIEFFVGIH